LFGQRIRYGSLVIPLADRSAEVVRNPFSFFSGRADNLLTCDSDPEALFLIAVAGNGALVIPGSSFFDGTAPLNQEKLFLGAEFERTRARHDVLQTEVTRIKKSVSWKITKPIRFFATSLRRITAWIAGREN
jgi:hypothetical protein